LGADESKDAMLRRAAARASQWLTRQQSGDGGWPVQAPEGIAEKKPPRLIRLDTRDYRDSTFALMLAADVLGDQSALKGAKSATEKLISLQLAGPGALSRLWTGAYRLDGGIEEKLPDLPPGADSLATRRAIETLLAASILLEDDDARIAAREAARSVLGLRGDDGKWQRIRPLRGELPRQVESMFANPATNQFNPAAERADFGITQVLAANEFMRTLGPTEFAARLAQSATVQERLATAVCGLTDSPFATDWPANSDECGEYLRRHSSDWNRLEAPPGPDLSERVERLYLLLLRARLEMEFGA
jgi:hypothetical protein